jgi:hypothetical protein
MAQAAGCFFRGTAAMVSRRRIHGWFLKTYRDYAESPSGDSALTKTNGPNGLSLLQTEPA